VTHQLTGARAVTPATDAGVEGNSRLTASTGMVLTVLLLVEGFTILNVRGYITLHTFIGLALIGPLALKCAATMYRFARYYTSKPSYVQRGAPALLLRVLGPMVVLSSVAVIGTGLVLLADHGRSGFWIMLHKASFVVWIIVTGVHFLGHILEAVRDTARDLRNSRTDPARRHRLLRLLLVAGCLAVGLAIAAAFTPSAAAWHIVHHG
jgi:arginine exporter protein ArgO